MKDTKNKQRNRRRAGILMPVSSLPSEETIGTLGKGAYAFVDWLESAGMRVWQVLPLLPTGYGDSPYQSCAADALNFYFIDLEALKNEFLLTESEISATERGENLRRVDYGRLFAHKADILRKAFARFDRSDAAWRNFVAEKQYEDFAVFMALKERFGYRPWQEWEEPFRVCRAETIDEYIVRNREEIEFWQFTQFLFLKQWNALKSYANGKGIEIMGDMPIYVAYDSVEVWKYRKELFLLDETGEVHLRAGVPPDAFSEDGQFWGNPVYDWEKQKQNGYAWWQKRMAHAFSLFDCIRIDHFRAFDRFYAIPADAENAKEGEWLDGPKFDLFKALRVKNIVAEDLGLIDEGVRKLLKATGFPGMKVFEFAFDGNPENEYLPSLYGKNCVAYTGTHDNDTLAAFLEKMDAKERKAFETALEAECLAADVAYVTESTETECASVVELLFASKADTVIVPMHDVLAFGDEARMNAPSTVSDGNWTFRFTETDLKRRRAAWLKDLVETYDR